MKLKICELTKSYGSGIVLDHVSCEMESGVTALLGNNGAGKSTLINIIVGLVKPDSGEIYFQDKDTRKHGRDFRSVLGYLPQECGFYNGYKAYQFLEYMGALKDVNHKICRERIEKYMNVMGLWDERNKKIKAYSGGMKHRLGIVQAMLNEPDILILDEPTTGLDFNERNAFKDMLTAYGKEHLVILSTHILSDVEAMSNHIVILDHGNLIYDENLQEGVSLEKKYGEIISNVRSTKV